MWLLQSMRDGPTYRDTGQRMSVRVERAQRCAKQGGTAGIFLSRHFMQGQVFYLAAILFIFLGRNYENHAFDQTMVNETLFRPSTTNHLFTFITEKKRRIYHG